MVGGKIDAAQTLFEASMAFRDKKYSPANNRARFAQLCAAYINTPAQLYQDLFVLFALNRKKGGFFVEFGACDGVNLSNTLLLEKKFEWTGILAEPGRRWHQKLGSNRNCIIDPRCVWSETGKVIEFLDSEVGELSTVKGFEDRDFNREARVKNIVYPVQTVSLSDLLANHNAPVDIDYLSVDTEGTEYTILEAFDFRKYKVKIATVEHNYVPADREKLKLLMERSGFTRVFEGFSKWDDWYINPNLLG